MHGTKVEIIEVPSLNILKYKLWTRECKRMEFVNILSYKYMV
jgi:hypothetical protein